MIILGIEDYIHKNIVCLGYWPQDVLDIPTFQGNLKSFMEGNAMGPYYRSTSQATGAFFDLFYQHPILLLLTLGAGIVAGIYWWRQTDINQDVDH